MKRAAPSDEQGHGIIEGKGPKLAPLISLFEIGTLLDAMEERTKQVLNGLDGMLPGFVESVGMPITRRIKHNVGQQEISLLLDGERGILLLDAALKDAFFVSLDSFPPEVLALEAKLLLGFALSGPSALEGVFVYDLKKEEFCFVVVDALFHGKSLLQLEQRARKEVAKAFVSFATIDDKVSTFTIATNRTFDSLPALLSKVFFNDEWEARVLVDGDDRWPVLGVRWRDLASPYVGGMTPAVVDWYYPRQAPLHLLMAPPQAEGMAPGFFFAQGVFAGHLAINPAHMAPIITRLEHDPQCVVKVVYAAEKG